MVGDLESVREWIEHDVNGLLCDPASPDSLAAATLRALEDAALRQRASVRNRELIAARADYRKVMPKAEAFYRDVIHEAQVRGRGGG